jgi:hypothetical protein
MTTCFRSIATIAFLATAGMQSAHAATTPVQSQKQVRATDLFEGCLAASLSPRVEALPSDLKVAATTCTATLGTIITFGPNLNVCGAEGVDGQKAAGVFVEHLKRNPADLEGDFRAIAQRSLAQAFPCRVRAVPARR